MTDIIMDPAVRQELASRGINEATGVYGNHQVKLGKSAPIRLDTIKSASIPFAGFSQATKISRGREGIARSADNVLRTLTGQADRLDARILLGNLKALTTHYDRLNALGQLTENQKADGSWTFTAAVEKLSNTELAKVFQTFSSAEMDLLQTALIREGRCNPNAADARTAAEQLFDLQALVIREISNRSINEQISQEAASNENPLPEAERPESLSHRFGSIENAGTAVHANDISAANLVSLAEIAASSSTVRERSELAADDRLKNRKLDSITVKEIGNAIRSSELTINIHTQFLIGGPNSILKRPNDPMVNIFHLHDQGSNPKGLGYLNERDTTEKVLFPELKGHEVSANERPLYGALNIAGNKIGAFDANKGYGSSVIVLKPEVAKRSTYTVNDSFMSTPLNTAKERRDNFYKLLDGANSPEYTAKNFGEKIPDSLIKALKNPESEEHRDFESFLDRLTGSDAISVNIREGILPQSVEKHFTKAAREYLAQHSDDKMSEKDISESMFSAFKGLCLKCFGDSEATRSAMATYDNVESLVTQMSQVDSIGLARAAIDAKNGMSFKAVPDNIQYIEAQIHGPLIPSRDIAEIRLYVNDIPENEREARIREMKQFGKDNGIKITLVGEREDNDDSNELTRMQMRDAEFSREHRDTALLESVKQDYLNNLPAKIQEYIADNKWLTNDLPAGVLRLEGNALANFASKFESAIANKLRNTTAVMTETSLVKVAFDETINPILTLKANLLREVEKTSLSTVQKAKVAKWVVAAKALRTTDEVRVILKNAQAQAEMFRNLARAEPPLTVQEAASRIVTFVKDMDRELSAMLSESYKGREVGPDDTMTEINRISFMSLTLLKNAEPPVGKEDLTRLKNLFDGPEMRQMFSQLQGIKNSSRIGNEEVGSLEVLINYIFINAQNLREESRERYRDVSTYSGDFRLIQSPVRNILSQLSTEIGQKFNDLYPPYQEFPAPVNMEKMPQNDGDRRKFLVNIMDKYIDHEKTFERGISTHGRGHIARAYIFADVMCNILAEKGIKVDKNAVLCGIAGHDTGRKGGGQDNWEESSGNITVETMKTAFGNDTMGPDYEKEVKNSIFGHRSHTIESMILNAADSLDIGRVGTGVFDLNKFMFLKTDGTDQPNPEIEALRQELAREADLLQRLTNPLCANRKALDYIGQEMMDASGPYEETLSKDKEELLESIATEFASEWDIPSDDYMKNFEKTIKDNPELFPILSKYYSGNAQPA
ncbi:DUF3626 domain-containing protein [Succinimonas amylolytica]|uniref:DUF3626 domain-containing protein n=1 Tax=Succinimonas amylolytica TaxID=83769 RepID=UPI0023A79078